jgi:perosamine synthetase
MIPYGRQSIDESDIQAVVRALSSEYLTSGPEVEAFEREFAAAVGAKHAVAVCNATASLHLALRVLGVGPGDRVMTSPNTFLASANAAAYVGATPDFSDIELVGYNLDPKLLEQNWKSDTKAVVAVDYAGQPSNTPEIARIARANGAYVIEDACHGVGGGFFARGRNWKLGGHPWADITTFSFHPVKTMTTGEGGILVTDNEEWAAAARLLRSHGVTRNASEFTGLVATPNQTSGLRSPLSEQGCWYYEMQDLGYNYRLTDIQCALGRNQLLRLPEFVARRRAIVERYNSELADLQWLKTPSLASWLKDNSSSNARDAAELISWHLYSVVIDFPGLGLPRADFMQQLAARGIRAQVLYIPVYLQPWYRRSYGYSEGKCPASEQFYSRALSLPLFPELSEEKQSNVIEGLRSFG